jgi:hypothetical protein
VKEAEDLRERGMVRGASTGAWKRANRSLEQFYDTPGKEEFREYGLHGHGGLLGGRRDEHQNAVEKIIDCVVGNRYRAHPARRRRSPAPARTPPPLSLRPVSLPSWELPVVRADLDGVCAAPTRHLHRPMSASIRPKSGKAPKSWMKDVVHETKGTEGSQIQFLAEGSVRESRRQQALSRAEFADSYAAGSTRPRTAGLLRAANGQKPQHSLRSSSRSTGRPQSAHPALRSANNSMRTERAAGAKGGAGLECVAEDTDRTVDAHRDVAVGPTEHVKENTRENAAHGAPGSGPDQGDENRGAELEETKADDALQLRELDSSNSPKVKSWTGVFPPDDSKRPSSAPVEGVHLSGTRFFTSSEAFEDWIMSREHKFHLQQIRREEQYRRGVQQARQKAREVQHQTALYPARHEGGKEVQRPATANSVVHGPNNRSLSPLRMNSRDSLCLSLANLSTEAPLNATMGVRVPVSSNPLYMDRVLKVMESQNDLRYRGEVFIFASVALS